MTILFFLRYKHFTHNFCLRKIRIQQPSPKKMTTLTSQIQTSILVGFMSVALVVTLTLHSITTYHVVNVLPSVLLTRQTELDSILNSQEMLTFKSDISGIKTDVNPYDVHQVYPDCPEELKCETYADCPPLLVTDMRQFSTGWIDGQDLQMLTTECFSGHCSYYFYFQILSSVNLSTVMASSSIRNALSPTGVSNTTYPYAYTPSQWPTRFSDKGNWDNPQSFICQTLIHPDNRTYLSSTLAFYRSEPPTSYWGTECYYSVRCDAGFLVGNATYPTALNFT